MNEKILPPRLMVLLVVLKGEKVYKIPLESGIKLDHLKDFNTLRRILVPLVQLYHGVGFDTRLTYDEFSKLKQAIYEVFENEKKKGGLMYKEPSLEPMESSIIRGALYLLTPQLP